MSWEKAKLDKIERKEKLIELLRISKNKMSIREIAGKMNINKATIGTYLKELEKEGKVKCQWNYLWCSDG